MSLPIEGLLFIAGEPSVWTRTADSGHVLDCLFCGTCGSRIAHRQREHGGRITLKPGTLDDMGWFAPDRHFFTEDSPAWVEPLLTVDQSSAAESR